MRQASLTRPENGTSPDSPDLGPLVKTLLDTIPAPVYDAEEPRAIAVALAALIPTKETTDADYRLDVTERLTMVPKNFHINLTPRRATPASQACGSAPGHAR